MVGLAALLAGCDGEPGISTLEQARAALAAGQIDEARGFAHSHIQSEGSSGEARELLGTLAMAEGRPGDAETEFRRAKAEGYDHPSLAIKLMRSQLHQGNLEALVEAKPDWSRLTPAEKATGLGLMGHAFLGHGKLKRARALYSRSIDSDSHNLEGLLGMLALSASRTQPATEEWSEKLRQTHPTSGRPDAVIGDAARRAGDFAQAEKHLQRATDLEPNDQHYLVQALTHIDARAWQPARVALENAKNQETPAFRLLAARLSLGLGDPVKAGGYLEPLVAPGESRGPQHYLRAVSAYQQGKLVVAQDWLLDYLEYDEEATEPQLLLIAISHRLGDEKELERRMTALERRAPSDPNVQAMRQWLSRSNSDARTTGIEQAALNKPNAPGEFLFLRLHYPSVGPSSR